MESNSTKVLIVDDDMALTRAISIYFERSGMEVCVAENGLRALEEIDIFQPDVVILDIFMPLMDGVKVCRFLRMEKQNYQMPIIVLTGQHDEEKEKEIMMAGASMYLTKPIDVGELYNHVEQSVSGNDGGNWNY